MTSRSDVMKCWVYYKYLPVLCVSCGFVLMVDIYEDLGKFRQFIFGAGK